GDFSGATGAGQRLAPGLSVPEPGQRGEEIGKSLALHQDVRPEALGGELRLTGEDGLDDALVLGERGGHPVTDPELEAAIWTEPAVQRAGLIAEEAVVTAGVDQEMELLVLVVVPVGVHRLAGALAGGQRLDQPLVLGGEHPTRGEAT